MKIKLGNGTEYDALSNSVIYPSYSGGRNRMEIHMAESAMTVASFEALFSKVNTKEIHFLLDNGSDIAYFNYSAVASVGKERVSVTSNTTGEVTSELELVVKLEQLTYIEQQLAALGIAVN